MRPFLIAIAIFGFVVALPIVFLWGGLVGHNMAMRAEGRTTTVSRLSPDDTLLARLIEVSLTQSLGREFKIQIQFHGSEIREIFHSSEEADAGQPGSERLIWSRDGTKLLVVGRHFFVKEDLFLDNGDQLFFLYDVPSGQGWCNSESRKPFPQLKAERVEGIVFTEPVVLRK